MKTLTVSIVIPVWNQKDHLKRCLDSIAAQTEMPQQVIVVDNNSTDGSDEIAKSYPFVNYLHEPRKGLTPTRNTGFAVAKGDIIGRINSEAELEPNWTTVVRKRFESNNDLAGLAGVGHIRSLPHINAGFSPFWSIQYLLAAEAYFDVRMLWGANMAIRRSAWSTIKHEAQENDRLVHEDQDISLLLAKHGLRVESEPRMSMTSIKQSYFYLPKFSEYVLRRNRTKHIHRTNGTYRSPQVRTLGIFGRSWRALVSFIPISCLVVIIVLSFPVMKAMRLLGRGGI